MALTQRKLSCPKESFPKWKPAFNTFLNSQFNASSAPSYRSSDNLDECIGYSEVGSNQGSTPELVWFHGIISLRLYLQAPSLNNAVYVISASQALITTTQSGRSVMSVFSCRFSVPFFSFETASPYKDKKDNSI